MTRFTRVGIVLTALSALVLSAPAFAQTINETDTTDANALANALIGGPGITVVTGTPTLIGSSDEGGTQQGSFTTTGGNVVGFNSGIILGSGYAHNVVGPNDSGSTTKAWDSAGNSYLDTLSGVTTHDANELSFNFTVNPSVQNLGFKYVFGSEEYNEFVGTNFNDSFAFLINGHNVALVNGQPVTINTINNSSNSADYIDNTDGHLNTQLDGLTTVLTANIQPYINYGGVNTLDLIIADGGDSSYDSDVFIQAGSLVSGGNGGGPTPNGVPEPSQSAAMGIGLFGIAALALKARKRRSA